MRNGKNTRVGLENEIRGMLAVYRGQLHSRGDCKGICYLLMEGGLEIEMEWQPDTDQAVSAGNSFEFFFAENGFPDAYSCDLRSSALMQRYPLTRRLEETSAKYKEALKEFLTASLDLYASANIETDEAVMQCSQY